MIQTGTRLRVADNSGAKEIECFRILGRSRSTVAGVGDVIVAAAGKTIEGEKDDISGVGQTEAAHDLCSSLPASMKLHHLQRGVGHYGVFNGSKFRLDIVPKIVNFVTAHA